MLTDSNLVIAMAHKEINEKSDGPDPCFAVLGKPSHKSVGLGTKKIKIIHQQMLLMSIRKNLNMKRVHLPRQHFL